MIKQLMKWAVLFFKKHKNQVVTYIAVTGAAAACIISYIAGQQSVSIQQRERAADVKTSQEDDSFSYELITATPSFLYKPYVTASQSEYEDIPIVTSELLHLAYMYSEGADTSSVSDSMAGRLYQMLASKDSEWFSGIYDLYNYTPEQMADILGRSRQTVTADKGPVQEFKNLNVKFYNGQGQETTGASNSRAIVAICNVLNYYGVLSTWEEMETYAEQLWKASHSYGVQMGAVYYCDGTCLRDRTSQELFSEDSGSSPDSPASVQTATKSEAASESESSVPVQEASPSNGESSTDVCPGHVDLTIQIVIKNTEENKGLFDAVPVSSSDSGKNFSQAGWGEQEKASVQALLEQDWYEQYGLNASDVVATYPLSAADIDFYMQLVPEDASQTRRDLVRYALASVGKIPYYWGGKPSRPGYTGNSFGSVVKPDESGRFLKGLDCSGWINWVYWSVTGKPLGAESTGTLISSGKAISKEELLPGDICIRTGASAHVVMFLGWSGDGRMVCIQETSAFTNNVEVALVDPDWPSYRRIIE